MTTLSILTIFEHVLAFVVGSIVAAVLAAVMSWKMAKLFHHPYWAPAMLLALVVGTIFAGLGGGQFAGMVIAISLIEIPILWIIASENVSK